MSNQIDNFDLRMTFYDIILVVFYLVFAYAFAYVIKSLNKNNLYYQKYFIKGLTAKFIGGIAFSLVYTYFYSYGGDTMAYYQDARRLTEYFFQDPIYLLQLLADPTSFDRAELQNVIGPTRFNYGGSEFPVVRVATILNILAMNSYYSTTVLFAAFSYVGLWHFYLVFVRRYPDIYKQLAIAVLFVPSVFFWGSGVMKDSIVLGFLGFMIYAIDKFLITKSSRWIWLGVAVLCGMMIFSIKAYVVTAIVPAMVIWVVMNTKDKIRNELIKVLIVPVLLTFCAIGVFAALEILGDYNSRYSVENFSGSARSIQSWHYVEGENTSDNHGRGSSYTLGDYEPTLWGMAKMFPASVNVTLFRPYFWEAKNIGMVVSAVESSVLLLFTLYVFLGLGIRRVLPLLFSDSFLMMSFTFAIFFAFAVGFTSYNFGALARYKIPCIPFYVASLMILRYKVLLIKKRREERIRQIAFKTKGRSFRKQKQFA